MCAESAWTRPEEMVRVRTGGAGIGEEGITASFRARGELGVLYDGRGGLGGAGAVLMLGLGLDRLANGSSSIRSGGGELRRGKVA